METDIQNTQSPEILSDENFQELAITVKDAHMAYGNNIILNGLNMNVPMGTIYGLLGPSGCGKTTLLKAIVNRTALDDGYIYVKANKKSRLGYMPQELSLYEHMNISETFCYFGKLYNMNLENIKKQETKLIELLDLPAPDSLVKNISGGQQRRVSFAVALLHDPELLILDEPTVGVDPLLRSTLWEHLIKLAKTEKKTIVITTHYIEETRKADVVALLRGGKILAEKSPDDLLMQYNCTSLDEVFVVLSEIQQKQLGPVEEQANRKIHKKPVQSNLVTEKIWNTSRFQAQLIKHFIWFTRNRLFLFYIIGLPILLGILCNLALSTKMPELPLAVVIEEGFSRCSLPYDYNCTHSGRPLSCSLYDLLKEKEYTINIFDTLEDANRSFQIRKNYCLVHFSKNYTKSVIKRLEDGLRSSSLTVDESNIDVWVDTGDHWISLIIKTDLIASTIKLLQNLLTECNYNAKFATVPIKWEELVYGSTVNVFRYFFTPGIICTFTFYLSMMFTTGLLSEEKSTCFDRNLIAGMNVLEVLAAYFVVLFLVLGVQSLINLILTYVIYDHPFIGSLTLLILLLISIILFGSAYGIFLTVAFDQETHAAYTGICTTISMFLSCGLIWPIQGMQEIMRSINWGIPLIPVVESYRNIVYRNWTIGSSGVYGGFISCLVWIMVLGFASYYIAKKRKLGV